jgi:hypothetical protein
MGTFGFDGLDGVEGVRGSPAQIRGKSAWLEEGPSVILERSGGAVDVQRVALALACP